MKKMSVLVYGVVSYGLGAASLVALIAFIFNIIPSNPILGNIDAATGESSLAAMAVNILLLTVFAVQHSVMARPWFKAWLARRIPQAAERSTYVLATAAVVFGLIGFWQPMPSTVWRIENAVLYNLVLGTGLLGWALVFYSTFLINHFDLFGLRQVWMNFRERAYTQLPFKVSSFYRVVRHPIMTGVFIGIWAIPVMTVGHLIFALAMSAYIFIGVHYEERDLVSHFGERYRNYMRSTARFFPLLNKTKSRSKAVSA